MPRVAAERAGTVVVLVGKLRRIVGLDRRADRGVVAEVRDPDITIPAVLGIEAVRAHLLAGDLAGRRRFLAATARRDRHDLVALRAARTDRIDDRPPVDRDQRPWRLAIERGEQRQQLAQPLVRAALVVGAERDRVADQDRRERVRAPERLGPPAPRVDQPPEQRVVVGRGCAVDLLAGDVPERDLDLAEPREPSPRQQRRARRDHGATRADGDRRRRLPCDPERDPTRDQQRREHGGAGDPGRPHRQPDRAADPESIEQPGGAHAEREVRHHPGRRRVGTRGPRIEHQAHHVLVQCLLRTRERRGMRVQGADRVDDELGLAVSARADHGEVDHRCDVVIRIGQRREPAELTDRIGREQRAPPGRGEFHGPWIREPGPRWTPPAIRATSRGFSGRTPACGMVPPCRSSTSSKRAACTRLHQSRGAGQAVCLAGRAVYAGYDPSRRAFHVGNLVPTIMLKRLQLAGHKPIIVVGGATGMVGDPSGKSAERNLLDDATLAQNVAGIHAQLSRLLDFDDPVVGAVITNNAEWTRGISFLEFLRDVGKHLTINYMMAKDSVKSRLVGEAGISYTEFSYMLLQAYDFVHLSRAYGCRLQVGGSDQYGNITAGCELSRKMRNDAPPLYGLVAPLLLDSSGQKMGKTATGETVWLSPERTRPYDHYQYWLNRPDEEAPRLLKMFSLRPLGELDELLREHDQDRAKRLAQREIARAMTTWVHGEGAVRGIEAANRVMFGGTKLEELSSAELEALASTLPTVEVPRSELEAGIGFVDLLARVTGEYKGAARRLIAGGGAYINDAQTRDVERKVTLADLATESMLVLRSGKRTYHLVRVV